MSNEMKWTQVEWVVTEYQDEVSVYMGDAVLSPYAYQCSDVWCCTSLWSEADETAIANAHLIAAAPRMYKLFELANCPHCDGSGGYYDDYGKVHQCQWCDE